MAPTFIATGQAPCLSCWSRYIFSLVRLALTSIATGQTPCLSWWSMYIFSLVRRAHPSTATGQAPCLSCWSRYVFSLTRQGLTFGTANDQTLILIADLGISSLWWSGRDQRLLQPIVRPRFWSLIYVYILSVVKQAVTSSVTGQAPNLGCRSRYIFSMVRHWLTFATANGQT